MYVRGLTLVSQYQFISFGFSSFNEVLFSYLILIFGKQDVSLFLQVFIECLNVWLGRGLLLNLSFTGVYELIHV